MDNKLTALRKYLESLPTATQIKGESRNTIIGLLVNCWHSLYGSTDQSTTADKLYRAEQLVWEPQVLSFCLERHGGTVNGSSRAELHHWEVDLTSASASIIKIGRRQLTPMDKRMDTLAKAQETARVIQSKSDHESLIWTEPGVHVVVQISNVIPETNQQTTQNRRKKYRDHLERIMLEHGWIRADSGKKIGFRLIG